MNNFNNPTIIYRSVLIKLSESPKYYQKLRSSSFKGTILSSVDHVKYENKKSYSLGKLQILKENVFTFQICIYLQKSSCLMDTLNDYILKITQSGIISKWIESLQENKYETAKKGKQPQKLTNEQFLGTYILCLCGLLISCVVFALEILSKKLKFLQNIFDFIL